MLKVAFLWHMHQPYYRDPSSGSMFLPWVRLHCLKDYYDLPLRVGRYKGLKMTFNLVPSLIEQIDLYTSRQTTDRHLELTVAPTADLSRAEKSEIFNTFFWANPKTMIEPYARYRRLYKKLQDCGMDADLAARTSSNQEIRDLVVWANLTWVDPILRNRAPFKHLFQKGESFTEAEKTELVEAQYQIMADIIPTYRKLQDEGKIEVSFTPFYHPILPLLCDTDAAREALPGITLPKNRFCHPEDAERQVALAVEMYRDKFGRELTGMWPSEGSISEQTAEILTRHGITWMASDEQVLYASAAKSGASTGKPSPHRIYVHTTPGGPVNIFFRDHALSDRIGFVYANWEPERAVTDFISQLHHLGELLGWDNPDAVVSIILDGENCWEYYPLDGDAFLNLLFERLSGDPKIETVTMSEACRKTAALPLKNILAGSWINHNFRVWIGHPEDNTAWDMLWEARRALTAWKKDHPKADPAIPAAAEKSLLVAEGSDWNWWYGDEHRGAQNDMFDHIYRAHLSSIYQLLSLDPPPQLSSPISSGIPEAFITEPEGIITPEVDGRLTHYYEWLGAGRFDCLKAGGTMHRIDRIVESIYFVSDDTYVYFRADFIDKGFLVDNPDKALKIEILKPGQGSFLISAAGIQRMPDWAGDKKDILCAIGQIAEIGMKKSVFFPDGRGELLFKIGVLEGKQDIELWPEGDPIRFKIFGRGEEIVWDL